MKIKDIQDIIDLLKLAKFGSEDEMRLEELEPTELEAIEFVLPENIDNIPPLISVDGSYVFLFSILGAETWISLFRVGITEYQIEKVEGEFHYKMSSQVKVYDNLNILSFNEDILKSQPQVFTIAANLNKSFSERNPVYFANNIMTYFEDLTLEKLTETRKDCILLKDGALLTFKALEREPIYKNILVNCRNNNISLVGFSKSTSTHMFKSIYTDDYFLKKYFDLKFSRPTYITVPKELLEEQTRFDVWGEVHFAKLNPFAIKWFRVDITENLANKTQLFQYLAAYSKSRLLPGYPIGLIEAHKVAKSVRDFKDSYELELYEGLKKLGYKPEDILEGAVDMDGRQLGSFHETLDQLSL